MNSFYLNESECKCDYTWIRHKHAHSFCTIDKNTPYVCRKINNDEIIGEVFITFHDGTTVEQAQTILKKYNTTIMQYTCWFEDRGNPYLTAYVGENNEESFIKAISNESLVKEARKAFFAVANV